METSAAHITCAHRIRTSYARIICALHTTSNSQPIIMRWCVRWPANHHQMSRWRRQRARDKGILYKILAS